MEPSNWAPEHSGALHEYLALGMTYSEIARAINAKFGTHYSRNATISRARRIGLGGIERPRDLAPLPQRCSAANRVGGMSTAVAVMINRMKPLPRRASHRGPMARRRDAPLRHGRGGRLHPVR
jgi:hypothetical protein